MNFLSHFYCHKTDIPEFNFGLLFPDFLGIVSREYKLHQFEKDYAGQNEAFIQGFMHHKLADELWHYHGYFQKKTELIKLVLANFGMKEKPFRPFFMTHVILEILLDRQLIKQKREVGEQMYTSLEKVDSHFVQNLFSNQALQIKFERFFDSFLQNKYVFSYADNEMFIYALNRLFSRVQHPSIETEERDTFVKQLDLTVESDFLEPLHAISNERIS